MLRRNGLAAPNQVLKTVTPASATDSFPPRVTSSILILSEISSMKLRCDHSIKLLKTHQLKVVIMQTGPNASLT